jgi:S1-C subfamily serine protease
MRERGRVCPHCASRDAWERYAETPLVIGPADIEAAEERVARESARRLRPGTVLLVLGAVGAFGLGALAAVRGAALLRPWPLGPLETLRDGLLSPARAATLLGAAALVLAVTTLVAVRRSRLFRAWPLIGVALLGLIAGGGGATVGGLFWRGMAAGIGWEHVAVPLPLPVVEGPAGDVARATAVILAPDGRGDARGLAIGTGVIIRRDPERAWILTCSHVAMPYLSPGAHRDPADAQPVWIYLSDGRNDRGRVVWTARPPLDVAVVTVDLPDAPAAIPVRRTAEAVSADDAVFFVPNPLRNGWLVHRGRVTSRRAHDTPAGRYSLVFSDVPVLQGDSGSGLFLANGWLVGLNTWRAEGVAGPLAIGLPSDSLREILRILDAADPGRLLREESGR